MCESIHALYFVRDRQRNGLTCRSTRMNLPRLRHCLIISALLLGLCAIADRCSNAYAQPRAKRVEQAASTAFGHQAWSSENGLPQNSVHQILQTRDGYIWIATE